MIGSNLIDCLAAFEADKSTKGVVMIGEIGGSDEEEAAAFIKKNVSKPVVAFIAGQTAPPGKRMGHAGAIVSGGCGTAEGKIAALNKVGIPVAGSPTELPILMKEAFKKAKAKPDKKKTVKKTKKSAGKNSSKATKKASRPKAGKKGKTRK